MPQVGETKTVGGVTGRFDGSTWRKVDAPPQEEGAFSRFLGGALSTSPLNPMNLVKAVAHPWDTIAHTIGDPLMELEKAGTSAKNAITNPGNEGWLGRLTDAVDAIKHVGGAVPLIGKASGNAGNKIGEGDIAGGAGELAGLASAALMPEAATRGASAVRTAGRVADEVLPVSGTAAMNIAQELPLVGDMIKATRGELPKIAEAASRGLRNEKPVGADPYMPNTSGYKPGASSAFDDLPEVPQSPVDRYMPNTSATSGVDHAAAEAANIERNTPYGNGGIMPTSSDLIPSERLNPALEGLKTPQAEPWDVNYGGIVPEFTYEGQANLRSGEFPPGPAIDMPNNSPYPEFTWEGESTGRTGEFPPGPSVDMPTPPGRPLPETRSQPAQIDVAQKWGPGSATEGGELAQAGPRKGEPGYTPGVDKANLLYDPQTPTSYIQQLRDEALQAGDVQGAQFYSRALDQRNRVSLAMEGMQPAPRGIRMLDVKPFTKPE